MQLDIYTIGDFAKTDEITIKSSLGKNGIDYNNVPMALITAL